MNNCKSLAVRRVELTLFFCHLRWIQKFKAFFNRYFTLKDENKININVHLTWSFWIFYLVSSYWLDCQLIGNWLVFFSHLIKWNWIAKIRLIPKNSMKCFKWMINKRFFSWMFPPASRSCPFSNIGNIFVRKNKYIIQMEITSRFFSI